MFIGRTDVEAETPVLWSWCEDLTHLKRPWCWERLRAGGEGGDRGWDDWMASPTQWTWVWVDSGSWWWTGSPGLLRFMWSQRVRHDWTTELNWAIAYVHAQSLQSCPTLWDLIDCSLPGSSVHGILQARILDWVAMPPLGNLPNPGIEPGSPALQADSLPTQPPAKPYHLYV